MGDIYSRNRQLLIKRYEHAKMVALANVQAREIRIIELEEEIDRNNEDILAQKKVVEEQEKSISLQKQEIEKEKVEREKETKKQGQ